MTTLINRHQPFERFIGLASGRRRIVGEQSYKARICTAPVGDTPQAFSCTTVSPPPPSRQGRFFPLCRGNPVVSLCALRGNLLRRPIELGSVDPHAVQNDRELPRDGNLGLAKPIALGELGWLPKPSALTVLERGLAGRRPPRTDTCGAWRHRTLRFGRTNLSPRRHGVGSSIRHRHRHFSIA